VRASHNVFLEKQWLMLWAFVDLLRGERWGHTDRPETGHVEHEQLLAAIAARDAALSRSLGQQHVDRAWRNIATRFENNADARGQSAEPPPDITS
jgi:DNA-binding GntR family transcriptional regulator